MRWDARWRTAVRWSPAILVVVGALLRLAQLASGRSLWLDESFLWLNLDRLSLGELTGPLDFAQGGPIPFLLAQGIAVDALGDAEWALRLVPFLVGVAVLPLAVLVARRYVQRAAIPVVVALFALAPSLIYYSAEAKQYSFDVAVSLIAYLLATGLAQDRPSARAVAAAVVIGAALLWFSDPGVFVLAGIAIVLIVHAAIRRDRRRLVVALGVGAAWLLSFVALYLIHIRDLATVRTLATGDEGALGMSGGAGASALLGDVARAVRVMPRLFEYVLGLPSLAVALAVVVALAGAVSMRARGAGLRLALLTAPLGVLLVAAAAGKYPLHDRFGLFTAPCLALLLGEGIVATWRAAREKAVLVGVAVAVGVLLGPLAESAWNVVEPQTRQEVATVVGYLADHRAPGDRIYVNYADQYAFAYYAREAGIATRVFDPDAPNPEVPPERYWAGAYEPALASTSRVIIGRWSADATAQARDVDRLRGPGRVWLVYGTSFGSVESSDQSSLVQRLSTRGRILDEVSAPGASAVLMELR